MDNRRQRKPTHPGELIREDLLVEIGMSQAQLARQMGVSRKTISDLVNERRRVTPDMAYRLARVFNSTPEMWLNMQQAVDLWDARAIHGFEYKKIQPVEEAVLFSESPGALLDM
jgi:addiction module HigA family antidote